MRWRPLFPRAPRPRVDPLPRLPRDGRGLPDVDAIARHYGLPPELRQTVVESARPSYRLERAAAGGGSRLGGTPDLPPAEAWPEYAGAPLTFFAQVRLDDLPAFGATPPLSSGVLQFFWDEAYHEPDDERGWCRILHHDLSMPLERRPTPLGTHAEVDGVPRDGEYVEFPVRAEPWLAVDPALLEDVEDDAVFDAANEVMGTLNRGHRLLAYADPIQGPLEDEAEDYLPAGSTPVLLLQLDCGKPFETAGALGDAGAVYFLLASDDLGGGRFDRAVAIMQCH
jgi:uncharacterized protein YwqG